MGQQQPFSPCGLFQSTSFECPASCIKLALDMCFTYANIGQTLIQQIFIVYDPISGLDGGT